MSLINLQGIAGLGGASIFVAGIASSNTAIETFPFATITIYDTETTDLVDLFQDADGVIPQSNPFTAADDASWSAYVAGGTYDVRFSGTVPSPYTLSAITTALGTPQLGHLRIASSVCALDSNVITGGGTDDTVALQTLLDLALDGTPLYLIMDGAALTEGLNIYGNTTIYCINSSCGFYLKDATDRALLRNANPSTGTITDKNIALTGGTYNGNSVNQTGVGQFFTQESDGTLIGIVQMYGVSNLTVHNVRLIHSKSIACHFSNVQNFDVNDIVFDNAVVGQVQQGGLQLEGLCRDGTISNLRGTTQDDFLAFSSDGALWPNPPFTGLGPYVVAGNIQNIVAKGLAGVGGSSAFRLFNGLYRIDNVIVDGVTGTWTRVFLNDPGNMALNGNVGTIVLANVAVSESVEPSISPIDTVGKMDRFIIRNFNMTDPIDDRPIINIRIGSNIKVLQIDGFNIFDTSADAANLTPLLINGRIQRLMLNNCNWIRDVDLAFPSDVTQAFVQMRSPLSSVQDLLIDGVMMNRVPYLVYYEFGFLQNVKLSNLQIEDSPGGAALRAIPTTDSPLTDVSVSNWFGQMAPPFFGQTPTRLRGDYYARDTTPPTFVSAMCNGGTDLVFVTFSESVNGINLSTGVSIKKNAVAQTILGSAVSNLSSTGDMIVYVLDADVDPGDAVTWEYVGASGFITDWYGNALADVTPQSVTNANTAQVSDRFAAVDSHGLNGRTPAPMTVGNNWVTGLGTAGLQTIVSGHARLAAPFDAAGAVNPLNDTAQSLTDNTTFADAIISAAVRFTDVNGAAGIVFRATNTSNFYVFTISSSATSLYKIAADVETSLGVLARPHGPDIFYVLEVTLSGNDITCTVNGSETITVSNIFNNTSTRHGLYASQGPGYFANFLVVTP